MGQRSITLPRIFHRRNARFSKQVFLRGKQKEFCPPSTTAFSRTISLPVQSFFPKNQTYATTPVLCYPFLLSGCPARGGPKPGRQRQFRAPVTTGSGGMASASKALPILRVLEYGKHQCNRLENIRLANARPSGVGLHRRMPQLPKTPKRETHDGPHHVSPFSGWAVCL